MLIITIKVGSTSTVNEQLEQTLADKSNVLIQFNIFGKLSLLSVDIVGTQFELIDCYCSERLPVHSSNTSVFKVPVAYSSNTSVFKFPPPTNSSNISVFKVSAANCSNISVYKVPATNSSNNSIFEVPVAYSSNSSVFKVPPPTNSSNSSVF